jgi:hypothetical protein
MGFAGRRRRLRRVPRALLALLALLGWVGTASLAGCGADSDGTSAAPGAGASPTPAVASTEVLAARLKPGQAVPSPSTAPVLTVTGRIGVANSGSALVLDAATIDQLGLRKVTLFEPWVKKTLSFQGVWLADLLAVAGAGSGATVVHLTALDDYQVDLRMSDVAAGGILLATRTGDGTAIPVADGGPTRIVFAGDVPAGRSAAQWIWSLKTIDVR